MVALCNVHVDVGAGTVASLVPAAVHQHGFDLGYLAKMAEMMLRWVPVSPNSIVLQIPCAGVSSAASLS